MKKLLLAAALLCLAATKALAGNPAGWPGDTWTGCTSGAFCLRMNVSSGTVSTILSLNNQGTGTGLDITTASGRSITSYSFSSDAFYGRSGVGDGIRGETGVTNKSGVVAINTSGSGSPGFYTNGQYWGASYNINSDPRLKFGYETNPYGLDAVLRLKPRSYKLWADPTNTRRIGLRADEVEAVMPLAVHVGPDGMKGIDYSAVTVALIETVKELERRVAALEAAAAP